MEPSAAGACDRESCFVAAVNRIGEDGKGHAYSGDGQVLDFKGDALLDAGKRDGVLRCTLRARDLAAFRERFPAYHDGDAFELQL
ncbi:Amidohydrolase OS=Stutzerimonas stutzeri OX=316 GN=CXK95_00205 PE=4 SV=1 [Stutzerimonas stutzeri]